jgi:rubrerythrin
MRTITVKTDDLVATLIANREKHRDTFEKALDAFKAKSIEVLFEQIEAIRKGGLPDRYLRLPVPEEHTADYDRAISMLAWHTEDTIELTETEFTQYVQDDWGWRQSFITNTASYTQ